MRSQRITFRGSGGAMLSARLDVPADGEPIACAIFAHCFTCSKLNAVVNVSRALTQERIAVLRFDFTGLGESAGEFGATNFSSSVEDLVAAAEFIRAQGLRTLDRADHLLTDERDSRYVGTVLAAWASQYLPHPEPAQTESELVAHNRVATRTGPGGFRTEVMARGHGSIADEPVAVRGTDTGPTPSDLLLAALGACTGMTLRMYADRKHWPLETVTVRLRHERIHAVDEAHCEDREARVGRIERELEITGELSTDQQARLVEIADRCPVHRTLSAGVHVDTHVTSVSASLVEASCRP